MKTGRAENKMKEDKECNLPTTREIIYLRKPGLDSRPGPPAPSAEPWPSLSTSPASPSTTSSSTPCRSKGTSQGGRRHLLCQGSNGTLHGVENCETAATLCCISGHTRGREDDPAVDTELQQPMGDK